MKKIDLGQSINTLANLGVIAGIVFLAFELRQNQVVGRAQTRNEIAAAHRELSQFDLSSPVRILVLRAEAGEPLNDDEQLQVDIWSGMWIRHFENLHYQYRQGLFDQEEFRPMMSGMERVINESIPVRAYFCRNGSSFSPSFVSAINSMLDNPCQ